MEENASLTEKLTESESIRRKYFERNKEVERENKRLRMEMEDLSDQSDKVKREANEIRKAR
jgi:DNA repair ATPase RecN